MLPSISLSDVSAPKPSGQSIALLISISVLTDSKYYIMMNVNATHLVRNSEHKNCFKLEERIKFLHKDALRNGECVE